MASILGNSTSTKDITTSLVENGETVIRHASSASIEDFLQKKSAEVSESTPASSSTISELKTLHENQYLIFYSTADGRRWNSIDGIGDVDYANALVNGVNRIRSGIAHYVRANNEKLVYDFIERHKTKDRPAVLHILKNSPRTGSAFTIEGLNAFKTKGGKVVLTVIEFFKYTSLRNGYELMRDQLMYMMAADQIIFLDKQDKQSALDNIGSYLIDDEPGRDKLSNSILNAKVICVPPTVPITMLPSITRGTDIICMSMIRTGKGLAHIIKLANLIKQSQDPHIKNRKIIVAGTVVIAKDDDVLESFAPDGELYRLLSSMYPSKNIPSVNRGSSLKEKNENNKHLKELAQQYQEEERNGTLKSELPIELHIDVPVERLQELFSRAEYSVLLPFRGVTLRNSSISTSLSQAETGLVTISHVGDITPPELKPGSVYEKAFVSIGEESNECYATHADNIVKEIIRRSEDPKLNQETLECAKRLNEERINGTVISRQHFELYRVLLDPMLESMLGSSSTSTSSTSTPSSPPLTYYREVTEGSNPVLSSVVERPITTLHSGKAPGIQST